MATIEPADGRTFYRIVSVDTVDDLEDRHFVPNKALGKPPPKPDSPDRLRSWAEGVSVLASLQQAQKVACGFRFLLGSHLAELHISAGSGVTCEKTGGKEHYDLRGTPPCCAVV